MSLELILGFLSEPLVIPMGLGPEKGLLELPQGWKGMGGSGKVAFGSCVPAFSDRRAGAWHMRNISE